MHKNIALKKDTYFFLFFLFISFVQQYQVYVLEGPLPPIFNELFFKNTPSLHFCDLLQILDVPVGDADFLASLNHPSSQPPLPLLLSGKTIDFQFT